MRIPKCLTAGALAACATAFSSVGAQSLTLYGVADAGVGYVRESGGAGGTGAGSDLRIDSGVSDDSRIGIRGREPLGGGLTARFELESGVDIDDGTWSDEDRFFDRGAWVGLAGGFGELRLGRQATFAHAWFSPVSPFATDYRQAGVTTVFGYDEVAVRMDNAVTYRTPSFGGFDAGIGYSFNDEGPEVPGQDNEVLTVGARYRSGPVLAVLTFGLRRDAEQDAAPARDDIRSLSVGGTYDFSRVKLHAAYGRLQHRGFSGPSRNENAWLAGVSLELGDGELRAAYQRAGGRNFNEFDDASTRDGFALAYEYPLSKRTALYAYGSRFRNIASRAETIEGPVDRTETGLGVRHQF